MIAAETTSSDNHRLPVQDVPGLQAWQQRPSWKFRMDKSPDALPAEVPESIPLRTLYHGQLVPIKIEGGCNTETDTRFENCKVALASGFPELRDVGSTFTKAPCVLVGTGLSAVKLLPEIRARYDAGEEVIAIKGAHDWLVRKGIIPRAAIALDAQQARAKCFKRLQKDVLYLCGSQMHPDTWAHMAGRKVVIWHSRITANQHERPGWTDRLLFHPASTTGNSALILMWALGRRVMHTYGFDSCVPRPRWWERWRSPLLKLDGARVEPGKNIHEVVAAGRTYLATPELIAQVQELSEILPMLTDLGLTCHGDGYYQAYFAEAKSKGLV